MTERRPLGDIQEESLSNNGSRAPSPPALLDVNLNTSPVTRYITPSSPRAARPRRGSSVSRVELSFFDPEGIRELERTLTLQSNSNKSNRGLDPLQSVASDTTLATKEGEPFDLAKTLRKVIQKSVSLCMWSLAPHNSCFRNQENHISHRELGVVFRDLRVVGLGATASHAPTLSSLFNPFSVVGAIQSLIHPPVRDIISGFEGVVRPGEMIRQYFYHYCQLN